MECALEELHLLLQFYYGIINIAHKCACSPGSKENAVETHEVFLAERNVEDAAHGRKRSTKM